MALAIHSITFDCAEPRRLAQFWASALDFDRGRMEDDLASVDDPSGRTPRLLFLQVPEGKIVKNRIHLDLTISDMDAEVARLVGLGARTVKLFDFGRGDTFTVMQDPEGNEFCVEQAEVGGEGKQAWHVDHEQQQTGQVIITMEGDKVALGPPHRDILPFMAKWDNDLSLSILSGDAARPRPPEAAEAEYEKYLKEGQSDRLLLVLYDRATLRPAGITELSNINPARRTAEFGIRIGEREYWGKGYGTEATTLTLDYAFTAFGLHNVILDVHDYNQRAIRTYLRAGFRVMGRRREAFRLADRVYDQVFMDCLATDFRNTIKPVLDLP